MKATSAIASVIFLCILLAACGSNDEPAYVESASGLSERTVIAYIAGDNSLTNFSTTDLSEMLDGMKMVDTKKNNMIVYIDRYTKSGNPVSPQLIRIGRNSGKSIVLDTIRSYSASRNSIGVSEMREVLSYAIEKYPATSYGLILWSHGEGWIPSPLSVSGLSTRWIGQDTNAGTKNWKMNITGLHDVLSSLPHFDYILFDACYMQSIEVAYELRKRADYFISSPTEIPGPGAYYKDVVPALFAQTGNVAVGIARSYYGYYAGIYLPGAAGISDNNWTGGVSVSVLKADKLEELATATRQIPLYTSGDIKLSKVKCYDPFRNKNYYDFDGLVKSAVGTGSLYDSWKEAYEAAVIFSETTAENYNTYSNGYGYAVSMNGYTGVSIYPFTNKSQYKDYYKKLGWYSDSGGL